MELIRNDQKRKRLSLTVFVLCLGLFLCLAGLLIPWDNTRRSNGRPEASGFRAWQPVARQTEAPEGPVGVALECRISVDEQCTRNSWLMFYTYHQYVDVYIGEECVYSIHPAPEYPFIDTVGCNWVKVPLYDRDAGKEIRVVLTPVYEAGREQIPEFLMGSELDIYRYQLWKNLPHLVIGGLLVLFGTIVAIPAGIIREEGALAMGISAVMIGSWRLLDSPFAAFDAGGKSLLLYYTSLVMLMGFGIPVVYAVKNRKDRRNSMIFESYGLIAGLVLIVQMLLQLLGLLDMRQSLWVTHAVQFAGGLLILVMLLPLGKNGAAAAWLHNRRITFCILAVAAFLDMAVFYLTHRSDQLLITPLAFLVIVLVYGIRFLLSYLDQTRQLKDKETQLIQSRTSAALGQIRSHFIFNVLNAISGMCKYDPAKADETVVRFSRYLRTNINILQSDELVTFQEELEYLEDYIALEQIRFGDRVRFEKKIGQDDFLLPPLLLQPIVENAIKHGLTARENGGTVCLETRKEGDWVVITVRDNGVGFDPVEIEKEDSVGIRNVRFRLEHLAGGKMTIDSEPGVGTCVRMSVPWEDD